MFSYEVSIIVKKELSTTDSLLFQIQMSEHNSLLCGGELHDNPHSQPTFLHIIIPSWQLTVSMHQNWFTHLQPA